jgi:hypothetical protein
MTVSLRCVDKDHKGEEWALDLGSDKVIVRDAMGGLVAEFPVAEAAGRFQMPSFSENIKYFGIAFADQIRRFDVPKDGLKEIRAFNNRLTAAAGPEAVQAVKNRAVRDTLIGVACAIGGVVLTVGSYMAAANDPKGGRYTVTYGLVIFGLAMLAKGIYGFMQYGQIKRVHET